MSAPPDKPQDSSSRRRRKEARPPEIVRAALEEFAEKGFAAAKLDDVARRARISKGTIYLYFADKEALFDAVVRETLGPVLDRVESLGQNPPGRVEDLLRAVVAHGVATGEFRDGPAARHPEVLLGPAIMAALWKMLFDRLEP